MITARSIFLIVLISLGAISQTAVQRELSQGEIRNLFLNAIKREFAAQVKSSGLSIYISKNKVPMNIIDSKFRDMVDTRLDSRISTLEAKLLVRHPQHITKVKLVKDMSYSVTGRICEDPEAEGNETDSARHFMAGFTLALLAGERFAHQYLTAHEGWLLDQNLDEYTSYNFASGLMDLRNNVVGIVAARKHRTSIQVLDLKIEVNARSLKTIKNLAIQELNLARRQNKLIAVYAKDGNCSQVSQRELLRKQLGLSSATEIW